MLLGVLVANFLYNSKIKSIFSFSLIAVGVLQFKINYYDDE